MSDREEWGPWIEHDGKGCPCRGQYVRCENEFGQVAEGIAGGRGGHSWDWANHMKVIDGVFCARIIRYRIRRPRALIQLRDMIETLPAPSRQKEDAHV